VFSAAIATNLIQHRQPLCNCFGQLHATPIGWSTFARNVALAAVAAAAVWGSRQPGALSLMVWTRNLGSTQIVLVSVSSIELLLLAGGGVLLAQLLKQQGRMLLRLEALEGTAAHKADDQHATPQLGLRPGTPAPQFELDDFGGTRMRLSQLLDGQRPALLVFAHPSCGPCEKLLPDIAAWQKTHDDVLAIAVISEGTAAANRAKAAPLGIRRVLLQKRREVADLYSVHGTPSAVAIGANGLVASYVAQGGDAIRSLHDAMVRDERTRGARSQAIAPGDPAPDLTFEDLSGKAVSLAQFRGQDTLLLFWNPQCGFCQRMLPDLRAWETSATAEAPRLLVVSSASDLSGMGLRAPVVRDAQSRAASAFAAHGTPMAVLIDREGRIASRVAAGSHAVFELANRHKSPVQEQTPALMEA
jgi:peroxiredoxin